MIIGKAQSFGETSQVYEAQKLRELEIFPFTWMSFGLNTRNSDSCEHAEWMEKLQSYEQHNTLLPRLLKKAERRKSAWSDSLPTSSAKEHKTKKNKKEEIIPVNPFKRDGFLLGCRGSAACGCSSQGRREQRAQPLCYGVCGVSEPASVHRD